ncbi:hypothetical protein BUALT_Bualt09G0092800 [Buddleja alternifolia]|uniref:Secoisolariciresinol dehydrogenase n=1 Tax=Buddleja alternifolia TaxID=168488 RepID=A0AAV6X1R2_9LAMI|nr:hypothetical protein BUALT_Bualt09G0092800 [Buddleja alternifolia]
MANKLQGKVALITGGASGIGEATAKLFTRYGAKVIIADIQDDRGQALRKELGSSSATISYVHCDVTKEPDVKNAVDFAVSEHGKLDIMFNNAGITPPLLYSSIFDSEKSHFEKVFDVNVFGAFLGAKHAARVMVPAKSGSIIFTASVAAVIGIGSPPAYTCSKHAVVGLTNHMCMELGKDGIRVNCISPFMVQTNMMDIAMGSVVDRKQAAEWLSAAENLKGRGLEPENIAEAAAFLGSDESKLQGKVALITGGASGIGEATAKLFTRYGAKVIIADIQDDRGQALCKELGSTTISYVHCDVTKEYDVKNAVDFAVSEHGKLDIMFNNAGIIPPLLYSSIFDSEKSHFEKVFDVNVFGGFLGAKHAARVMVPAKSGSIIFTASAATVIGLEGPPAYTCSKHAVVGLTNHLCMELGKDGIRVNCISPFLVQTPMVDAALRSAANKNQAAEWQAAAANLKGVILKPDDIAEAAAFLGSDESKYVSGLNLVVDGGYSKVNPLITNVIKGSYT